MIVSGRVDGKEHNVVIVSLTDQDYGKIQKSKYFFDWKTEKENEVYKLTIAGSDEILGLISLIEHEDKRIQINLLAVS
jgi:hypothetical protein